MANKQRGEIDVKGQEGRVYTLKLGTAALCELEAKFDSSIMTMFEELQAGGMKIAKVREFVKSSHVPEVIDDAAANALIDDVGVIPILDAMKQSILAIFKVEEEAAANPPTPVRRRGGRAGADPSKRPSLAASAA